MFRRHFMIALVSALVAAACSSTGVSSTTRPTQASTPSAAATVVDTWTVAAFGDSFANLHGWPTRLADLISDEYGVEVEVIGDVCFGGCSTLERIQGNSGLRSLLAAADVIVLQPQPGRVLVPLWRSYFAGECGGEDGLECFREAESAFRSYVEELLDEVLELSQPGAVVRAVQATGTWAIEAFNPGLQDTDPDAYDVILDDMLILSDHIAEAAAERCIGVVDANAIMSGPSYREPVSPAYSNDGKHPSGEGSRVIAASIYALGLEPTLADC